MRVALLAVVLVSCAKHHVVEERVGERDAGRRDAAGRDVGLPDVGGLDVGTDAEVCSIDRPRPFPLSELEAECLGLAREECAICHRHPRDGFTLFPDAPPPPDGIEPFEPGLLRECLCDGAACDLSRVECTALPGCLGESPPETMYCDDVRICINGRGSESQAEAINSVARRIECFRADSCDYLCMETPGFFDDDLRADLCAVSIIAPEARIECAIYGP